MSRQRESKLSTKILKELRQHGAFCWKNHGNEYTMAGLPDIIVCYKGEFIGLEVKMPEKRNNTSVSQDLVHGQIRQAGGKCYVVCGVQEAVRLVTGSAE